MRKKIFTLTLFAMLSMSAVTCHADIGETYESVSEEYGTSAQSYITQTAAGNEQVHVIYLKGVDAAVSTSSNVRAQPSADAPKNGTIDTKALVKVWGITDNGWAKVYCVDEKGTYTGYIRADLLVLREEK